LPGQTLLSVNDCSRTAPTALLRGGWDASEWVAGFGRNHRLACVGIPGWDPSEYACKACAGRFDDLTGTVLAGHHQPLRVWVLCLPFMGLNLSNRQIAKELGLCSSDVQVITEQLRHGVIAKAPEMELTSEVEIDEVYVVAGHKGQPAAVAKRGGLDAVASWQARRAAARWRRTSRPSSA